MIRQEAASPAHQLVTLGLPGLKRATVRVPEHIWLTGDHLPIHGALTGLLARCLPPKVDSDSSPTFDDISE